MIKITNHVRFVGINLLKNNFFILKPIRIPDRQETVKTKMSKEIFDLVKSKLDDIEYKLSGVSLNGSINFTSMDLNDIPKIKKILIEKGFNVIHSEHIDISHGNLYTLKFHIKI